MCVQLALYMRKRVIMQECDIGAQQRAHRNSVYTVSKNLFKKNENLDDLCLVDRQVTLVPLRQSSVFTSLIPQPIRVWSSMRVGCVHGVLGH